MPEPNASLASLIGDSTERLRQAGIAEPRRLALRIWAELQGVSHADALLGKHAMVTPGKAAEFRRAVQRRRAGEPLAYVTGWAGFRHLVLQADRRALIPRPETEGLIDLVLQRVRSGTAADVGTGTGCIAYSLALEGSFRRVVGVDCSSEALELAQLNRKLLGCEERVGLIRADLCSALQPGSCDALVSNPPYLTVSEYAALDTSVRDWEPALALQSGEDGLEATLRLLTEGQAVVRPGGWLALEVDCVRAGAAARLAVARGWSSVSIHMDLFGRERYLLAQRSETR
ncbi:MAG TPA: peptide chain release factor N(5)-glutamine methyltransferase [Gemmatimonadales bacterium]|nr:peptide chain release factor N(5)-glutamine methyltransferase [Gemmatimonadales bacterium]